MVKLNVSIKKLAKLLHLSIEEVKVELAQQNEVLLAIAVKQRVKLLTSSYVASRHRPPDVTTKLK